jgi:hypothetical protein
MDEPGDVTAGPAGLDDSLAGEVGDRVRQIVNDGEREALAIAGEADEDARRVLEQARAEARELRETARNQAHVLAADRVRRILQLHTEIASRAESLAAVSDDPDAVRGRLGALLRALAGRAELIARELGVAPPASAADEPLPEPREAPPEPPLAPPEPPEAPGEPRDALIAATAGPDALEETRLGALRMAVAGASREELEGELAGALAVEDATAVLDDVFGSRRSPFPRWTAAMKRAG